MDDVVAYLKKLNVKKYKIGTQKLFAKHKLELEYIL